MRTLFFALALGLAACGSDQAANTTAVSEDSDGADVTAVNDLTAIDAATGEAANMAADVNYTLEELDNETNGTDGAGNSAR